MIGLCSKARVLMFVYGMCAVFGEAICVLNRSSHT